MTVLRESSGQSLHMACIALAMLVAVTACSREGEPTDLPATGKVVVQNTGSDTMVNLAQWWAEQYAELVPAVSVEVSGGGSGTGIAALINGTADIANCSRQMEPEEIRKAQQNTGQDPQEFVVGYDALAVYVHRDNPLNEINLEQLAEIYGEDVRIDKWSQLGIENTACKSDELIRVSRQSNSGTYYYFRAALLGKERDFRLGSRDLHGSKDVVELVGRTPCAIGYSGMGYTNDRVKMLKIARKTGEPAYGPAIETALDGSYPIARPLYMYTLGRPSKETRKYLQWTYSDAGQAIVEETGFVPLPEKESKKALARLEKVE